MKKIGFSLILMTTFLLAACFGGETESRPASSEAVGSELEEAAIVESLPTELPPPPTATAEPPTATIPPTEALEEAPTEEEENATETSEPEPPTLTPPPPPTTEPDDVQVISGQTSVGAFFLGDADASLTIIDYSDFL